MDVIGEVIIINNNPLNTPAHAILNHPKVKLVTFGENIFVNPAWNFGVQMANNDIVGLLNDDLIFDLKIFYKINDFMQPDMGAIGLASGRIDLGQIPVTNGEIFIMPYQGSESTWGFGELMFVHKKYWIDIPRDLKIGFGDNWIFERYCFNEFQNYFICNLFHYHTNSSSIHVIDQTDRLTIYEQEVRIYDIYKKYVLCNPANASWLRKHD
jgi:hypothetical protein